VEKRQALEIIGLLERWTKSNPLNYEIDKLELSGECLPQFHQWTNGKPVAAGYNIAKLGEHNSLYFLFIDWHRKDNYYLVIYSPSKSTTHAEIQEVVEYEGSLQLHWKYNPLKRDGKNLQRKAYFKQMFGSTSVYIPLPISAEEVENFIKQLFRLCANRVKADGIVDVFQLEG
jgi:hypothetical protein